MSGKSVLDSTANPRFFAWFRISLGVLAAMKGFVLLLLGAQPLLASAWIAAAALMALGIYARLCALAVVVLAAALLSESNTNHLYLILLLALLVAVSQPSKALTFWRPKAAETVPGWPATLMLWQASLVYFYSGVGKLNSDFLSGDVFTSHFERSVFALPASQVLTQPLAIAAAALELLLGIGLWVRRIRPALFALMVPLHVGMLSVAVSPSRVFEIALFALLMFILVQAFSSRALERRVVVWDDQCSFCRTWTRWFRRLDVFHALEFIGSSSPRAFESTGVTREAAAMAMQLVAPDGQVKSGYAAVCGIVAVLPFGYLVSPWMRLPGVRELGDRSYKRVAARRACNIEADPALHPAS
jgi:predicted DCC family thiol-disulfide oxidoreductase YuxK